jgi:hypothetical protein
MNILSRSVEFASPAPHRLRRHLPRRPGDLRSRTAIVRHLWEHHPRRLGSDGRDERRGQHDLGHGEWNDRPGEGRLRDRRGRPRQSPTRSCLSYQGAAELASQRRISSPGDP